MILIKINKLYKIVSDNELTFYLNDDKTKIIGKLKGDYPSLRCSKVSDRKFNSFDEIIDFFNKKIINKQKKILVYEKQLNTFIDDLKNMGFE